MKKFAFGILASIWLVCFWFVFAQSIPDNVEISVKDPLTVWEATNLKITMMKNWSKMTTYKWTIRITVTDQNWKILKSNEYTVPSQWMYKFLSSDLWEKEFQKWLEIKKEWTFYIEIQDLNEDDEKPIWKQLIHVIGDSSNETKNIEIFSPISNANLIGNKVEVIATASDVPNSNASIYIDWNKIDTANVSSNWSINHVISNINPWQHTLSIEISDLDWNIIWKSETVSFTVSSDWTDWIKNITVEPEIWLIVWDMTTITVNTDENVESIKLSLSDRPSSESIIMNKKWIGQFVQNVFLIGSWEVFLSFNISSSNNTINRSYDNYKSITVSDSPSISNIKINTDPETKTAEISWDAPNNSVSSYLIDRRIEWSKTLSWKERSEKTSFKFKDVPYDTIVKLNITPYWNNQSNHGAASKTIQFVISKDQNTCWNWTCDNWESHELCPQDCEWEWETTIILWPSCPAQSISTHTEKIWNSYYLVRDKAESVKKYIIYSSPSPDWKDKVKVYETTDTSYEYPFDHTSKEDVFMYFWVIWVCEDWEEIELTWATKVKVWPAENFFLLVCLTLLIYFWIKLFRHTEE